MTKCDNCGEVMFSWDVAKHQCDLGQVEEPQQSVLNDILGESPVEHIVTQETLDSNPELVEEGVEVGEVITFDAAEDDNLAGDEDLHPQEFDPEAGDTSEEIAESGVTATTEEISSPAADAEPVVVEKEEPVQTPAASTNKVAAKKSKNK